MILLLGASGYIGSEFIRELGCRGMPYAALSRSEVDYTHFGSLLRYIQEHRPDFIINAAGYTGKPNVDACETRRAETLWGNVLLPATVGHACLVERVPWAHISTGCIYNGTILAANRARVIERDLSEARVRALAAADATSLVGFNEADPPNFTFQTPPSSFYSGAKALAEEVVSRSGCRYIWRTRLPFDHHDHPRNYLSKLQRYSRVYDNLNSVSNRGEFVRACLHLLESNAAPGVYNLTNPGFVSTREVIDMVKHILKPSRTFEYWKDDQEFYAHAAVAHRSNCILDVSKALSAGVQLLAF